MPREPKVFLGKKFQSRHLALFTTSPLQEPKIYKQVAKAHKEGGRSLKYYILVKLALLCHLISQRMWSVANGLQSQATTWWYYWALQKTQLVAKRFNQEERIDFFGKFDLHVNNAFVHGVLGEEVYMQQPLGLVEPLHPHYVCLLHKAIYGLWPAARAWSNRLRSFFLKSGFHRSSAEYIRVCLKFL